MTIPECLSRRVLTSREARRFGSFQYGKVRPIRKAVNVRGALVGDISILSFTELVEFGAEVKRERERMIAEADAAQARR
jgi:hypothetical protein